MRCPAKIMSFSQITAVKKKFCQSFRRLQICLSTWFSEVPTFYRIPFWFHTPPLFEDQFPRTAKKWSIEWQFGLTCINLDLQYSILYIYIVLFNQKIHASKSLIMLVKNVFSFHLRKLHGLKLKRSALN